MANILDKRDKSLAPSPGKGAPVDKAEKFSWAKPTTPGVFRLVNKSLLNVDDKYQRDRTSEEAVKRIARTWDWTLFEVLMVAEREDKSLWVFSGGHRTRASFYRSDIIDLPCMIFQLADISDEARSFIAGAKMKTSINSLDTFRAAVVAMEPAACKTAAMLSDLGIKVKKTATRPNELKCVHTVQNAVIENAENAKRVMSLVVNMANEEPICSVVFRGIFRLVQHFKDRDILAEYAEEFARLTQQEIEKAIRQTKAEIGKGGEAIEAKGVIVALNKGKKTRKLAW